MINEKEKNVVLKSICKLDQKSAKHTMHFKVTFMFKNEILDFRPIVRNQKKLALFKFILVLISLGKLGL